MQLACPPWDSWLGPVPGARPGKGQGAWLGKGPQTPPLLLSHPAQAWLLPVCLVALRYYISFHDGEPCQRKSG